MPSPSVTYTFANDTTSDATQINQCFTDLINALSDGTKDLSVSAITAAGNVTFNGNTAIGNSSADDLTITSSLASTIPIKTTNTYNIGSATKGLQYAYFGSSAGSNTARLGGFTGTADVTLAMPLLSGTLGTNFPVTTQTDTYLALVTDGVILMNCATSKTVTLPAAATCATKIFYIKKIDSSFAVIITIDGNAAETIDGATTTTLSTQNESITIYSDGTNWQVLDRNIPRSVATVATFANTMWSSNAGAGAAPTNGTIVTDALKTWREGAFLCGWLDYGQSASGGAGAAGQYYTLLLPNSLVADTTDIKLMGSPTTGQGTMTCLGDGIIGSDTAALTTAFPANVYLYDTTHLVFRYQKDANSRYTWGQAAGVAFNSTQAYINVKFRVPISNWKQ